MEFRPLAQDLSIFDKFDFEWQPVGVKYLYSETREGFLGWIRN